MKSRYIEEVGILPSVRVATQELARFAAETVYSGYSHCRDHLDLARRSGSDKRFGESLSGYGRRRWHVLDDEMARRCVDAGARFLTSPGFVPEVVAYARKVDVCVLPGALTPTEIIAPGSRLRLRKKFSQQVTWGSQ